MTIAFVHGVPETAAIWDDLIAALGRDDAVTLSPPGFGTPIPAGFACTTDAYRDWLIEAVAALPGPVDLVGHDWGGGHVLRLAMDRPDLIRSWTSDVLGILDPEYVWHDLAQTWQTPGAGERAVADMAAAPAEVLIARYQRLGLGPAAARSMAEAATDEMGRAILSLYRSAAQPRMRALGGRLPEAAARPGLALIPTDDPYTGGPEMARRAASRAGARVAVLEGRGHWWMGEDPEGAARALRAFLDDLP